MDKKKSIVLIIAAVFLFLIILGNLTGVYIDWIWFASLGYLSVFKTMFFTRTGIWVLFFVLFLGIYFLNTFLPLRYIFKDTSVIRIDLNIEGIKASTISKKIVKIFIVVAGLFFALVMASVGNTNWLTILKFLNKTPFNLADPIFNRDIGFYVFTLPVYQLFQVWLTSVFVLVLIVSGLLYLFTKNILIREGKLELPGFVRTHLSIICGIIMLLVAWNLGLKIFETLYSRRGVTFGASYIDINALILSYRVLLVISFVVAVLFFLNIKFKKIKYSIYGLIILVVLSIIMIYLYPEFIRQVFVKPNELTREEPYIKNNINFTLKGYNLEKIETKEFPAMEDLTYSDIQENETTVQNIKIWDKRPLIDTYKQIQEIRLYYDFSTVSVDRYIIDGKLRQVMLSPRELAPELLPAQAQTWVNLKLKYTHGYGLCLSPVNTVVGEGLPDLWIKDIPPVTSKNIEITRPEIYYGQKTSNYVIVKTETEEFDYPRGNENVYCFYEGEGGVPFRSFFRRLLLAYHFSDIKILFSGYINNESRIMFHRNIKDRISKCAPFLVLDDTPYITVAGGKQYWIQDAYTKTDMFPYSTPYRGLNYIRNSVKIVVDTYNGKPQLYVMDDNDPLIQTYRKIFPDLFKDFEKMPQELKEHIRYPRDLFKIQMDMYKTYHMQDVQVFYNQEDLWEIPQEIYQEVGQTFDPYYIVMKLPNENLEEFMLLTPFTPSRKNNMIALMVAKCDQEQYGKLFVYLMPKQKLVFGPLQIEARIDQYPQISELLTLWGQKGSKVIRGDLLVIPIEQSLIYVEPIYLEAEQSQLPELKKVIVAFGNFIVMEDNLEDALVSIFLREGERRQEAAAREPAIVETLNDLISQALNHYNRAQELLREGDWNGYGTELQKLKEVLERLNKQAR